MCTTHTVASNCQTLLLCSNLLSLLSYRIMTVPFILFKCFSLHVYPVQKHYLLVSYVLLDNLTFNINKTTPSSNVLHHNIFTRFHISVSFILVLSSYICLNKTKTPKFVLCQSYHNFASIYSLTSFSFFWYPSFFLK